MHQAPIVACALCAMAPLTAQAPITINGPKATLKAGVLLQGWYEAMGDATLDGTSQGFYIRRARLMFSGTLGDQFEYFVETDNPNLGKWSATSTTSGAKNNGGLIVQDAILTWKAHATFKLDMGLILAPLSHHSTQGATNLLTWDYSPYAFLQNKGMETSTGRDTGVQARGTFFDGHLEYRVGAFQGKRIPPAVATTQAPGTLGSRNALRVAGRVQFNVFDAENGLFMAGTYLGTKKILSFGVGHDRQDDYQATAVDAFLDLPLGSNGLTIQADLVQWDGKTWLSLPKQQTLFTEAGFRIGAWKLAPMVRYETQRFDVTTGSTPDETRASAGLTWWIHGHNTNLKLFYTRVKREAPGTPYNTFGQGNLQFQLLAF